ncbi:MAG TPA: sigma factor [Terriglobia bacterium]
MTRRSSSAISSAPATAVESSNPATPEALVAQAAEGSREALIQIYDRFAPRLLGLVRRLLRDADESERVLEEVFVKLWREAHQVARARVSLAAWLTLVTRAQAVNRLRSRAGPVPLVPADVLGDMLQWLPDPGAIVRLDERRALLQKVLGQLPRPQIKSLELVMFEGCNEIELADNLGEPLARTKSELRAATRFLKHRRRAVVGSWTVTI